MTDDEAVKEFLGERPGASELREWRITLQQRLEALEAERKRLGATARMDTQIATLRKQLAALQEEEAITQFVEDSVRVTLAMGTMAEEAGHIAERSTRQGPEEE